MITDEKIMELVRRVNPAGDSLIGKEQICEVIRKAVIQVQHETMKPFGFVWRGKGEEGTRWRFCDDMLQYPDRVMIHTEFEPVYRKVQS